MSNAPVLHVSGPMTDDGNDCARCGAVLCGREDRFLPSVLVVMPTGHYGSARVATPDDLRTGALCEVHDAERGIPIRFGGMTLTVARRADLVVLAVGEGPALYGPVTDAQALAQALRECIGPIDREAAIDRGRRFVDRMNAEHVRPRPTELGATDKA